MKPGYRDTTDRERTEGGSGLGGPEGQPSAEGVAHSQHDLAQTPGKFTDDAPQAGEGAEPADDGGDVPTAIKGPTDPPSQTKATSAPPDRGKPER